MDNSERVAAAAGGGFGITEIIDAFGLVIYLAIGLLGVWGVFNAILLYRGLKKKGLTPDLAEALVDRVRDLLGRGDLDGAVALCQNPPYWHSALGQLAAVALRHLGKGMAKVKQVIVADFHTEVISGMEARLSTLSTVAKLGPLLGLLGTVMSMIAAFGRMGEGERADPSALASAISLGLWTTAAGLIIATPVMMVANDIQTRLRKLRDRTERYLQDLIEVLEDAEVPPAPPAAPAADPRAARAAVPR